jgi:3',5'-cyclic AMP phosphodiesterase CpdA
MRTIVHVSDIHFGRTDDKVVRELVASVHEIRPDLVAISGDLTQRARPQEFELARLFLDMLPGPQIVVPGNHDVPLHNVYARFRGPLDEYRRYIAEDLEPFWADGAIAVLGLNTARSLTIKGGRVNEEQVDRVEATLGRQDRNVVKILVSHHPFDLPGNYSYKHLVGRARKAMTRFIECRVDVFLAGHYHLRYCGRTAERYNFGEYSSVFVQAGTACSTRGRGESNSYNVVRVQNDEVEVETMSLGEDGRFSVSETDRFSRTDRGWAEMGARDPETRDLKEKPDPSG